MVGFMKMKRIKQIRSIKRQRGMTLIELLVAGIISLISVSGMVIVMANTLGTSAQTIKMSSVSQEMRTAMQIMTRELRRANYQPGFLACYGDTGCLTRVPVGDPPVATDITDKINVIQISDTSFGTDDCFWFWYERPDDSGTGSVGAGTEYVAAFRRSEENGVGKLQMTSTRTSNVACTATDILGNWEDITDPNVVDVLTFSVDNADVDFPSIVETINAAGDTQSVQKIALSMTAQLTTDASVPAWIQSNVNATRQLDEFVKVRNHTTSAAASP
jgi:Tfp pilus assembly protein PilW